TPLLSLRPLPATPTISVTAPIHPETQPPLSTLEEPTSAEPPVLGPAQVTLRSTPPVAAPAVPPLTPERVQALLTDPATPVQLAHWVQEHLAVRGADGSFVPKSAGELDATLAHLRREAALLVAGHDAELAVGAGSAGEAGRSTGARLPGDVVTAVDHVVSRLPEALDPARQPLAAIRTLADFLPQLVEPAQSTGDLAPLRGALRELSRTVADFRAAYPAVELPDLLHPAQLATRVLAVDPGTGRFHVLDQAIAGVLAEDVFDAGYAAHVVDQLARAVPMDPELAAAVLGERARALVADILADEHGGFYHRAVYSAEFQAMFIRPDTLFLDAASAVAHESEHALQPDRRVARRAVITAATTVFQRDVALARLTLEREMPAFTRQREFFTGLIRRASVGPPDVETVRSVVPARYAWLLQSPAGIEAEIVRRYILSQPGGADIVRALHDDPHGDDTLLHEGGTGAGDIGPRVPMTMKDVRRVAHRYGVDASDVRIVLRKDRIGYEGSTGPDQTISLTRDAFTNEVQLARTLAHERYHVDQLRSGVPYPTTKAEAVPWEREAYAYEEQWWRDHPLNPDREPPDPGGPVVPPTGGGPGSGGSGGGTEFATFNRELTDRVRAQAHRAGTSPLAELQQFAIQRALARIFAASPDAWVLKGGQSMLARFPGARESSDIDLIRISGGDRDAMAADYSAALQRDLGDYLTFVPRSRVDLANVPGVRLAHTVLLGDRELMTLSVDLVPPRTRPVWQEPAVVPMPAHILETGSADERPDLRIISVHDVLAHKVSGMYTYTGSGGPPERAQDLVDILVLATNTAWDGPATHAMLREEIAWRLAQGEPMRVPDHFEVPNPAWGRIIGKYAASTPGLPYMNLGDALPLARAFLDPLLRPTPPRADWDPRTLSWVPRVDEVFVDTGQPDIERPEIERPEIERPDPAEVRLIEAPGEGPPSTVFADQALIDRWDTLSGGRNQPGSLQAQIAALKARTDLGLAGKINLIRDRMLPDAGTDPSRVPGLESKNLR
ncbi:MAG TPA: nucleotidyl transferase AbiEii/AbiGii toxin family protein, partial [Micromonosporaceae bacterium]|nr:nucleotidyl transferase AbiEii/AbiGii toxin family protein [Micromonosporaceae bacterium]